MLLADIFDLDYDSSDYWFLIPEAVYEVANITALNALTDASGKSLNKIDEDEYFRYLYAYNTTNVYVNHTFGRFSSFNGTVWTKEIEDIFPEGNDMIVFEVNGTPTFFTGTDRAGYYEPETPGLSISSLDDPESDSITCDYQTYKASDLQESAVLGFFYDDITSDGPSDDDELYALTYGKGLWRNVPDGSARKWQRE